MAGVPNTLLAGLDMPSQHDTTGRTRLLPDHLVVVIALETRQNRRFKSAGPQSNSSEIPSPITEISASKTRPWSPHLSSSKRIVLFEVRVQRLSLGNDSCHNDFLNTENPSQRPLPWGRGPVLVGAVVIIVVILVAAFLVYLGQGSPSTTTKTFYQVQWAEIDISCMRCPSNLTTTVGSTLISTGDLWQGIYLNDGKPTQISGDTNISLRLSRTSLDWSVYFIFKKDVSGGILNVEVVLSNGTVFLNQSVAVRNSAVSGGWVTPIECTYSAGQVSSCSGPVLDIHGFAR